MKNTTLLSDKILRVPIFPLSDFKKIPYESLALSEFIDNLYRHKIFSEAVYLSSPSLHAEWGKIVNGEKERGKMNESILKYYLRSFSNTVPFGLFSTYSISTNENCKNEFTRFTNIDMDYLSKLIEYLNKNETIRKITTYRKNNTIYRIGNHYRYIEPKFDSNELSYTLSSIEWDELIELLLAADKSELYYDDIKKIILNSVQEVTEEEVELYINQLLDSKIYLSCFEVVLNTENSLEQIISFYENHKTKINSNEHLSGIFYSLNEVNKKIKELDLDLYNSVAKYKNIYAELNKIGVQFEEKYVINSNLRRNVSSLYDEKKMDKRLYKLLTILTKLSHTTIKLPSHFEDFKKNFYNRYENQEVPLLELLDNELGIGYNTNRKEDAIFSDLIDDMFIPGQPIKVKDIKIEPAIYNFWLNVLMKNEKVVDLEKENLDMFASSEKMPDGTFSVTYSYVNDQIFLKHSGGVSASQLIGRFSNNDPEIMTLMNKITDFEKSVFEDKITAEIMHLPANRAGNILIRKVNRDAELSIISKTSNNSYTIDANDLVVSLRQNKIFLRSKKQNKEILPFLTSAQNYHYNSLPIYQFLCDLQTQERVTNLSINYGGFSTAGLNYMPRLIFGEHLILQKATWLIKIHNFKKLENLKHHLDFLNVPQFFYITNNKEDKMIIDKENVNLLKIFFNEIEKSKIIRITECIYDMDHENEFANEFISVFKTKSNENKITRSEFESFKDDEIKRNFIYGSEWIYFKIYTGRVTADQILLDTISKITTNLLADNVIDKWFFLRYTDPDFHLRVRFHLTDMSKYNDVSKEIYSKISELEQGNKIWKLDLSTYKRELERYYWKNIENSETIFFIDSKFTIDLLSNLKDVKSVKTWFFILKSIDDFFTAFDINLEDKYKLMQKMFDSFWIEHGSEKSIKKEVDLKFRKHEKEIQLLFNNPPSNLKVIYSKRIEELKTIKFDKKLKEKLPDLVWSYIHMHVNRFIPSNPRLHELILYGILEKKYKKEIGISKYNTNLVIDATYQTI
ncbi:lantibiotic dehydratase [Flavobacterium sp. SLB02]|uniref:lantibiotic dehydratase n=1 Tax=Flavobacterium sp. SLB02 TaxID=2665645 RepID=UPI0012AA95AD|nr:lantibiotic dehydratase [Flavobacterium sp. SLB02]QGK74135.1 hypothetical protein GIY83_08720 [Flavobacterium sp. SLB02]